MYDVSSSSSTHSPRHTAVLLVKRASHTAGLPDTLYVGPEQSDNTLPWLHGTLTAATTAPQMLTVQVHNRAGIPIITGHMTLEPGVHHFTIQDLHPLGIEAYAHYSAEQRMLIAQRVWSRAAYATLRLHEATG
jgi:hypothetical protein